MDANLSSDNFQVAAAKITEAAQKTDTQMKGRMEAEEDRAGETEDRIGRRGIGYLVEVAGLGLVALFVYASQCSVWRQVASVGFVVAGAALLVGGLSGFLFGIPHTIAADSRSPGTRISYLPSTDLEQIADWLTKILVGVSLTQISTIPSKLTRLGDYLKPSLGGNATLAVGLSMYFALCGFLIGFLWTRIYLPRVLKGSDAAAEALASAIAKTDATAEALVGVNEVLAKRVDERRADDAACVLVSRQLSLEAGLPTVEPDELKDKIKKTTVANRAKIFFQAVSFRSANWKDKHKMDLVIPIFEALVASDSENQYPEYHGQLGWALRDLRDPHRYAEAFDELDTAIKMHERLNKSGEPAWFKFQRAVCRILLDKNFAAGTRSDDETTSLINDDLKAASRGDPVLVAAMENEEVLKAWRTRDQ